MDFIQEYLDSLKELECPESYHVFACLGALSCLTGKKVWCKRGGITSFPNLYIGLIGNQGSGKSTAMKFSNRLIKDVPGINFSKACSSSRDIIESVNAGKQEYQYQGRTFTHTPMAMFLGELSGFIAIHPVQIIDFLTFAYDEDHYEYGTYGKGSVFIKEPVLSGVFCCTHEWFTNIQQTKSFTEGMGRRTLWLMDSCEKRNRKPKAFIPDRLKDDCVKISQLVGEFQWSDEADKWHERWYADVSRKGNFATAGYYGTKHVLLEKIAMLVAMSNRKELIFKKQDFVTALSYLEMMEKNLEKVYEGCGRNPLMASSNRVVELAGNNGGISLNDLRLQLYANINNREIEDVLNHLRSAGQIVIENSVVKVKKKE